MGEGESKKEEGALKDGDGREPEAKKKKQSKIDTSSDSEDDEDDGDDDDDEASAQMCRGGSRGSCPLRSVMVCFFFFPPPFHRRKAKAERNTPKWTKRCAG